MSDRPYDALLLDLDGTLLDGEDRVHRKNLDALRAARAEGVRVMVVTGRSKVAALPVLETLGLDDVWSVVFNGAAVYCPRQDRLVEERTLSNRAVRRLHEYGAGTGDLTVVMTADRKLAGHPRSEAEARSLEGLTGVELVAREHFPSEFVLRVTFLGDRAADSDGYAREVEEAVGLPLYLTHFPLSVLPRHRASRMHAVDVHAPCRGKAEALRVLREVYGIPAERVVAVGDASNDVPMVRGAGLGVAMANSMPELLAVADRVIGGHETPAIAGLVEELFLGRRAGRHPTRG